MDRLNQVRTGQVKLEQAMPSQGRSNQVVTGYVRKGHNGTCKKVRGKAGRGRVSLEDFKPVQLKLGQVKLKRLSGDRSSRNRSS